MKFNLPTDKIKSVIIGCSELSTSLEKDSQIAFESLAVFVADESRFTVPKDLSLGGTVGIDRVALTKYLFDTFQNSGDLILFVESTMTPSEAKKLSAPNNIFVDGNDVYFVFDQSMTLVDLDETLREITYFRPGYIFSNAKDLKIKTANGEHLSSQLHSLLFVVANAFDGEALVLARKS